LTLASDGGTIHPPDANHRVQTRGLPGDADADAAGLDPEIAAGSIALVESAVLPRLRNTVPDVTP
jgi:hypothetical protein